MHERHIRKAFTYDIYNFIIFWLFNMYFIGMARIYLTLYMTGKIDTSLEITILGQNCTSINVLKQFYKSVFLLCG